MELDRVLLKADYRILVQSKKQLLMFFDENWPTIQLFEGLGFVKNPNVPRIKYDYFGEDFAPVHQ